MDKKKVLKKFLESNEVLIVDNNPLSRNRLLKIIFDLGAKRSMIHTVGSLSQAQEIIKSKKIGVVLSDYFISGGSGFDLFKMIREKYPKNKELCLFLVTSNISQIAVAKAAEEDVDSFIIKPYTTLAIEENLISTVTAKIYPSEYKVKIDEGKELIASGKYNDAINVLNFACSLHPRPALALFYIGQAEYLKKFITEARSSYDKGLRLNNIHFKCLVGLHEVLMNEEKYLEAYQVAKKISKYFPANPDRLAQVVRLAVRTGNYQDMQMYNDIFTQLDVKLQEITNYIGAGMYVAGKYCLVNNDYATGMQYFENIAESCSEFTKFLRAIITVLLEHGYQDEAEKFLSRFDKGKRNEEDYLMSDFLVRSKKFNDPELTIKLGLDLWNKKLRDYLFIETLISALEKRGYPPQKIAPYRKELVNLYPEKKANIYA